MMQASDARLTNAIQGLTASGIVRRFDVRATIALTFTLAILAMAASGRQVPGELWLAFGTVLGYFFPKTQEQKGE